MSFFGLNFQPFKGKVSFQPGKMNLGDLIGSASMVAGGGLGKGMFDVGKWSTGNIAANLGLNNGLSKFQLNPATAGNILGAANTLDAIPGARGGGSAGKADIAGLMALFNTLGMSQAQFALQNEPRRQRALTSAYNSFNPAMILDDIGRFRSATMGNARQAGMQGAAALDSQGMNGAGAILDAINRGTMQANTYAATAGSSDAIGQRRLRQAQIMDSAGDTQGIQTLLALLGAQNNQRQVNASLREPSVLEKLLSVAGQVAPYMVKNK